MNMFFIGTGGIGLFLLVPMLFIMFSKSGAKWIPAMMWIILGIDLLFGSLLFAAIQGGLIGLMYHRRNQARSAGPPQGPWQPGPYDPDPNPPSYPPARSGNVASIFKDGTEHDREGHEALS